MDIILILANEVINLFMATLTSLSFYYSVNLSVYKSIHLIIYTYIYILYYIYKMMWASGLISLRIEEKLLKH